MVEPTTRDLPDHVTIPLLTRLTQQALEEDYRLVAERRAAAGERGEPRRTRPAAASAIAVFGLLIAVAAVQASRDDEVTDAGRATLISRIQEERAELELRRERIADLTRGNQALTESLTDLTSARQQAVAQLRRLQLTTGYLPATGEGVRVVVDGNPVGDAVQQVTDARRTDIATITAAERLRSDYYHRVRRFLQNHDYLLCPTVGVPPYRIDRPLPTEIAGRPVRFQDALLCTYAFSVTGLPVISVPCGFTRDGLPVGLQIVGRRLREDSVLEAAAAFLLACPQHLKRPVLDASALSRFTALDPAPEVRADWIAALADLAIRHLQGWDTRATEDPAGLTQQAERARRLGAAL